jgi:hypothetical protein
VSAPWCMRVHARTSARLVALHGPARMVRDQPQRGSITQFLPNLYTMMVIWDCGQYLICL